MGRNPAGRLVGLQERRSDMLRIQGQDRSVNCEGVSRRSFLQAGFLGLAGLSLADFLCLQEQAAAAPGNPLEGF